MHAMQQPIPMSTGTQTKLSTILLTHYRSSVSYNQRGSDTKRCGTPAQSNRFTLHCQPRDQVFWQHTTTWYRNNCFIDASGLHRSDISSRFEAKRHTWCCWTVCTLFNEHDGASITRTTRQRKNDEVELHSTGTPTWTRPRHEMRSDANQLA